MIKGTEEFERLILHGLYCEWENTLSVLDPPQRKLLHPPLFSLRDMNSTWGYWSREKREISLSRDLVFKHPWDAVCEVFIHEIAHQYTDEVLFAYNEPPHGPQFQKACYLLRANPKASGNYKLLDKRIFSDTTDVEDKTLRQVKKLICLAESQNRHEAEAAMAKAHKLIAKYNLEIIERNEHRDYASIFVGKPALRHTKADYMLAHLLQDFYFIKGIWVSAYVLLKGKMGMVLEISGTIQNIQTASYVHDFVHNFINGQWAGYNKYKKLDHHRKLDFSVGVLEGFRSKLAAQNAKAERTKDGTALINIQDLALSNYFHYRYPRIKNFSRQASCHDPKVLNDGKRIGKNLVISKGIVEKNEGTGLLTEN